MDIILVVGAGNSSNSNRLRETAEAAGKQAYLINDPKDIDYDWLRDKKKIGITSGASTPEWLVQAVIDAIKPTNIDVKKIAEENITFVLPKTLR